MKKVEISLKDLFDLFIRRLKWIVIITAAVVLLTILITTIFVTPKYTATATMLISSYGTKTGDEISYSEQMASLTLVDTYLVILKSNTVLEEVSKELDGKYSAAQLGNVITAEGIGETQIIKISVETTDAQVSADIANAFIAAAPDAAKAKTEFGKVEPIDGAKVPTSRSSPNLTLNIIIAFLAGLVFSFIGFYVYESLDTILRAEEDLIKDFDIPLLGTVPSLEDISSKTSNGGAAK